MYSKIGNCHPKSFCLDLPEVCATVAFMSEPFRKVLFLCTGNYYRSRFAQAIFNLLAEERGLSWRAFSRGLDLQPEVNPGTLSVHTRRELERRGLPLELAGDEPRALSFDDIQSADRIYALKEAEHRPLMQAQFPNYVDKVIYWTVHDLDCAGPDEALPQIEKQVITIVEELVETEEATR